MLPSSAAYRNVLLLVTGFSLPRAGFNPGPGRMGFMVDNMALGAIYRLVLRFVPVIIILPLLHTHCHRRRYVILATDSVFKYHTHHHAFFSLPKTLLCHQKDKLAKTRESADK